MNCLRISSGLGIVATTGGAGPEMPKKSQKGRFGPVGPECQKSAEEVEKVPRKCRRETFKRLFRHFFGTPGRQAQDDLFETFLGISGPEGPALPVTGRYNRNSGL